MNPMRVLLLSLCLACAAPAAAQLSPLAHEVALLAPQLEAFAGSRENFEALTAGLRAARAVTLTSTSAEGAREIVTFTPAEPLAAMETARLLERARQILISHGIAAPGAQQIGIALMGGELAAPSGKVKLAALVAPADPKKPALAVTQSFLGGSAANYRSLVDGLSKDGRVKLATPGRPDTTFSAPGGALSGEETKETLRIASGLLAAQGIHDPTPEQLRAALVGGTVVTPDRRSVVLRGVLEGRTRATSASPPVPTSDSPRPAQTSRSRGDTHTSDSPQKPHTSDRPSTGFTSDTPPAKVPATK